MRELTYLATPYSHVNPSIRLARFRAVNKVAGILIARGLLVISPISHSHPIAARCAIDVSWETWKAQNEAFLRVSRELLVLTLDGWRESKGVTAEIEIAYSLGLDVQYIDEAGNEISWADHEGDPG